MRIAFYAPMKPPAHPVPSGDRRMAALVMAACTRAGHAVSLASEFRSYDGTGDRRRQADIERAGRAEGERLLAVYQSIPLAERPQLWFTYHLYHKAPDWIGPTVSRALGIPYVIAEAAHAPKQSAGDWAHGHAAAAAAIGAAEAVLCVTRDDAICVEPLVARGAIFEFLPPFLDPAPFALAAARRGRARATLAARERLDPEKRWLLAVGMMREGDKLASYRRLGEALARLDGDDWRLLVVGDGPARPEVERALAPLGKGRIALLGPRPVDALAPLYGAADVYVWPAVREAYGMALLEAAAAGLPVVAERVRGVPDVVRDGVTGLLVDEGDARALAGAVRRLLDDAGLRRRLADGARRFVQTERSLEGAARTLGRVLRAVRAPARAAS